MMNPEAVDPEAKRPSQNLPDDRQDRLARVLRLRRLGVQRGAAHLTRPAAAGESPTASSQGSGDRSQESGGRNQKAAISFQPPVSNLQPPTSSLPGHAIETPFGAGWSRAARFALVERPDLADTLGVETAAFVAAARDSRLADLDLSHTAFIDTETTGLAPDTGTYTFLVGIGLYEPASDAFVVHQHFMRNPAEERALLHLVEETLASCTGVISFNGRGFDLPMLQNRFVLARRKFPWINLPHFDLLPAARRVWRRRLESCRLSHLEQHILGVQRTEEDVPGALIPDIYTQYHCTGVVTDMLVRVFYHNLIDITTMPLLAGRLGQMYQAAGRLDRLARLHPLERVGLGRAYVDLGWFADGEAAYRSALDGRLADDARGQVFRDLSFLLKRLERRTEAVAMWEEWISAVPGDDVTPYIELAKHHEWQSLDLLAARGWVAWAARIVEGWQPGYLRESTSADLQHRLARIERKMAGEKGDSLANAVDREGTSV